MSNWPIKLFPVPVQIPEYKFMYVFMYVCMYVWLGGYICMCIDVCIRVGYVLAGAGWVCISSRNRYTHRYY